MKRLKNIKMQTLQLKNIYQVFKMLLFMIVSFANEHAFIETS